jgi:hypothetical protein
MSKPGLKGAVLAVCFTAAWYCTFGVCVMVVLWASLFLMSGSIGKSHLLLKCVGHQLLNCSY